MANPVYPPFSWLELDTQKLARNWTQDADGVQREKANDASAIAALTRGFNYVAARMPTMRFSKLIQPSEIPTEGVTSGSFDPMFRWKTPDDIKNGRTYAVRMLVGAKGESSNKQYSNASQWDKSGVYTVDHNYLVTPSANLYVDCFVDSYNRNDTAHSDTWLDDGVSTWADYHIHSITVQDEDLTALNVDKHLCVRHGKAKKGERVLYGPVDDLRSAVHQFRTTHLPRVMQWASVSNGTPATTDETAIVVDGEQTDFVNLFDQSVNARSATSPGSLFYCYKAGIGREDQTAGLRVPIQIGVRAQANVATNILFIGPEHVVPNWVNIEVSNAVAADWYWATSHVYGNPAAHENTTSVNRNKLDAFVPEQAATGRTYIYNIEAWINDPMSVL